jgi:hypothetical protein
VLLTNKNLAIAHSASIIRSDAGHPPGKRIINIAIKIQCPCLNMAMNDQTIKASRRIETRTCPFSGKDPMILS